MEFIHELNTFQNVKMVKTFYNKKHSTGCLLKKSFYFFTKKKECTHGVCVIEINF